MSFFSEERQKFEKLFISSLLKNVDKVTTKTLVSPDLFLEGPNRAVYQNIAKVVARGLKPTFDNLSEFAAAASWSIADLDKYWTSIDLPPAEHYTPKLTQLNACDAGLVATQAAYKAFADGMVGEGRALLSKAVSATSFAGSRSFGLLEAVEAAGAAKAQNDSGLKTGWPTLDVNLRLRLGDVVVIGAGTNVGKTTAIVSWLLGFLSNNVPCAHISLEDSVEDTGERYGSQLAGISRDNWTVGRELSTEERQLIKRTNWSIPWLGFYVPDRGIVETCNAIRVAAYGGSKVVAVDYFQNILIEGRHANQVDRYNAILAILGPIAKECGIVLVLASQIRRREVDPRSKQEDANRLHYEDLAGTSNLEKSAQSIVMMWKSSKGGYCGYLCKNKRGRSDLRFNLVMDQTTGAMYEPLFSMKQEPEPEGYE